VFNQTHIKPAYFNDDDITNEGVFICW